MTRKLSFDEVKKEFGKKGYKLLDANYENNQSKMKYICPFHFEKVHEITLGRLKSGRGCPECGKEKAKNAQVSRRLDYDYVKKTFEDRGYILLENYYENVMKPMRYICPEHPKEILKIAFRRLAKGQGCKSCGYEKYKGINHHNWNGGTTSLRGRLRYSINKWKLQSMKDYGYTCFVTGENYGDLQVHHTYPFSEVIKETVYELGLEIKQNVGEYTEEEIEKIKTLFEEKHKGISGMPLRKEVHKLFHSIYGYKNIDFFNVVEFRDRYLSGEFEREIV